MRTFWTVKEIEGIIKAEIVSIWEENSFICMEVSSFRIKIRKF